YPLPRPFRLLDTRAGQIACDTPGAPLPAGGSRTEPARVTCDGMTIPASAQAIVGNATVDNSADPSTGYAPQPAGYITLWPSNASQPYVSNLNYVPNQRVANAFTVGLGPDGAFKIYAYTGVHFIVDVTGYYAPPGAEGLYFHPLARPVRLLDTRAGGLACDTPGAPIPGDSTRSAPTRVSCEGLTIPAGARAVVGNATVVNPAAGGYGFV